MNIPSRTTRHTLKSEVLTVEQILNDSITLRVHNTPPSSTVNLSRSDIITLAQNLNIKTDELLPDSEQQNNDPNEFSYIAIGVMISLIVSAFIYIWH